MNGDCHRAPWLSSVAHAGLEHSDFYGRGKWNGFVLENRPKREG